MEMTLAGANTRATIRAAARLTIAFLERVVEEMPFPIQRVQTDCPRRGSTTLFTET
jgi:hypothetical protein